MYAEMLHDAHLSPPINKVSNDDEGQEAPPKLSSCMITQVRILHMPVLYPTDISTSSQSMFGMLNRFTFDPGISDQFTDVSIIRMPNHLHRYTISTSKHHLQKIHITIHQSSTCKLYSYICLTSCSAYDF